MVPVKDEEDGLQYLIQDLDGSGIREEYDISFIFVIDERTSDNSREFAARMSEQIVDQRVHTGRGMRLGKQSIIWRDWSSTLLFS